MSKKLLRAVKQQKKQTEPSKLQILGTLGVPLGGQRLVEVPNRNSFVYVQLRSNQNEVIQAFNNQVSPSYGLPVIVQREGNRYIILGVDTQRYQNNWNSFSSYLPRHGNTHSFEPETGGGGDVTFVFSRQFMPLLSIPSGSLGGPNVIISPYTLRMDNGTWKYVGNTGTASLLQYIPTGSNAVMVLVYIDADTGNPGLVVGSGAYFANTITGAAAVVPYIPQISNPNWIPDAAIRLVTGTATISWDNIYDVRQFLRYSPTGTSMFIQNNGATLGDASILNFIMYGANNISISGTTARIFVSGSGGGSASINTGTLDARYLKINTDNDPLTGPLQIIPTGAFRNALYAESDADDIVGDFEQLPTTNGNMTEPVMFLYRGPFGVNNPFFRSEVIRVRTDNPPTGTNAGGLLKYFVNGDTDAEVITAINPHIGGTGTATMFDTTASFQWDGNLLLLKNAGVGKFYVDGVGTSHSNETYSQAFIHDDSGISFREQNIDGSFVWLKGDIGSGGISGYLRSQLQAFVNTSELITNGSFESGTFVGWTQIGGPLITTIDPFSGRYAAQCTATGTISQTLSVVSSSYYLLEFDVKMDSDSDFHGIVSITNGDQSNYDAGNQHGGKWIRGAALIRASASSMTLEFKTAPGGTNFVYFDNITLKLVTNFSLEGMDSSGRWNIVSPSATPLLLNGTAVSTLDEAPINSGTYGRKNAGWVSIIPQNGWNNFPGGMTFISADSPSFVVTTPTNITGTVGVGDRIWLTHQSQNKFFLLTAIGVTGSTSYLNLYGGTDYTLNITGAITNPFYSQIKAPFGFPLTPAKWTVSFSDTSNRSQANPSGTTWYNLGSLSFDIPIGVWNVGYKVFPDVQRAAAGTVNEFVTLSTANNTESDADFTVGIGIANTTEAGASAYAEKVLTLLSKTTYYINARTTQSGITNILIVNALSKLIVNCVSVYL